MILGAAALKPEIEMTIAKGFDTCNWQFGVARPVAVTVCEVVIRKRWRRGEEETSESKMENEAAYRFGATWRLHASPHLVGSAHLPLFYPTKIWNYIAF